MAKKHVITVELDDNQVAALKRELAVTNSLKLGRGNTTVKHRPNPQHDLYFRQAYSTMMAELNAVEIEDGT